MDERRLLQACQTVVQTVVDEPAYAHTSRLLVTVGGRVVFDRHLRGRPVADVFSVTKTVLGLLCGAAVLHGHLPDLDVRVADVRPDLAGTAAAGHTVRHLLTMTRGAQADGPWDPDEWTVRPVGQVRHIADAPQVSPAGQVFSYDNAGAHLLAALLDALVPAGLAAFADDALFVPLGLQDRVWRTDDTGIPYGHAHLHLSAPHLGRVGRLLQDGTWEGERLVDRRFLRSMTTPSSRGGPPELLPYGWLCWLDGDDVLAGGWAGQHVLVRRRDDVVVVVTGDPGFRPGPPAQDDLPPDWRPALELVRRHVVTALDALG